MTGYGARKEEILELLRSVAGLLKSGRIEETTERGARLSKRGAA